MDTPRVASRVSIDSTVVAAPLRKTPPAWIGRSRVLIDAYALAAAAHGDQRRPSDGRHFLEHVVEVAELLREAGFDHELVAVGLLHDAVERGTLGELELRAGMGASICSLVLTLSEDSKIASFDWRKADLRRQVESAGGLAVTVYAADKLSDIRGLRRGIELYGDALDVRLGTTVGSMTAHYRESVEMVESVRPGSVFLPALRQELGQLQDELRGEISGSGR
jgi:HD domain